MQNRPRAVFLLSPIIALSCIAFLLRSPTNRERKLDRLAAAVERRLVAASPSVASSIERCRFLVAHRPIKPLGIIYLFCPAGANLAELSRDGKNADLDDFEFRVIPTTFKDSPSSEMALVLAVHDGPGAGIKWLETVAGDPIGSKPKIAKAFNELDQDDRDKIIAQMRANLKVFDSLGKNHVMLQIGKRKLLGEDTGLVNFALNGLYEEKNSLR